MKFFNNIWGGGNICSNSLCKGSSSESDHVGDFFPTQLKKYLSPKHLDKHHLDDAWLFD